MQSKQTRIHRQKDRPIIQIMGLLVHWLNGGQPFSPQFDKRKANN